MAANHHSDNSCLHHHWLYSDQHILNGYHVPGHSAPDILSLQSLQQLSLLPDLNYACRGTESINKLLKLTQLCQAAWRHRLGRRLRAGRPGGSQEVAQSCQASVLVAIAAPWPLLTFDQDNLWSSITRRAPYSVPYLGSWAPLQGYG